MYTCIVIKKIAGMATLTAKEEEIMQVLWRLGKAFVKEILDELPEPKPHYNTVSTVIRKLEEKGHVGYESFGKTHRYYPILNKEDYREEIVEGTLEQYFDNSFRDMVVHYAKAERITPEELKEILDMIENKKS